MGVVTGQALAFGNRVVDTGLSGGRVLMTLETQTGDTVFKLPWARLWGFPRGVHVVTYRALLAGHRFVYITVFKQFLMAILCPRCHRKGQGKEGNGRDDEYLSPQEHLGISITTLKWCQQGRTAMSR
jgi:hypothetical protein